MQVTIVYDSNISLEECEGYCGVDWSSSEATMLASQQVRERFGDKVELVFVDLAKTVTNHNLLEQVRVLKSKNLSLPVLLINGKPRISGQFDIRQLMDAIEAEMEMEK